jgi:hypothetical protein
MMILFLDTYVSVTTPLCEVASIPALLLTVPRRTLETFTGNMLGDGSVRYSNFSRDRKVSGNARYSMTMSVVGYEYLVTLYNTTLHTALQVSDHTLMLNYHNMQVEEWLNTTLIHDLCPSLQLYTLSDTDETTIYKSSSRSFLNVSVTYSVLLHLHTELWKTDTLLRMAEYKPSFYVPSVLQSQNVFCLSMH